MSYPVESVPASKNAWFTPNESNAYYKTRYAREGITVHWWGDGTGANNHDNIVNYFLSQAQQGVKSVNYVVSDNKITEMVNADNVAFCSQNGNPTTISIEFQPTLSAEGYKRGGWLIAQMEQRYSHTMSLYPHSHWYATSCPGSIDISRLRTEANNFIGGRGAEGVEQMIIGPEDNWFNRCNRTMVAVRGRQCSREEFIKYAVGNEFLRWVESVEDSPEADANIEYANVGRIAKNDKWDQQIYGLQAQLLSNNELLDNLNRKAALSDGLKKELEETKAKNQACIDQQAKDEETGKSFFRAIANFFKK